MKGRDERVVLLSNAFAHSKGSDRRLGGGGGGGGRLSRFF